MVRWFYRYLFLGSEQEYHRETVWRCNYCANTWGDGPNATNQIVGGGNVEAAQPNPTHPTGSAVNAPENPPAPTVFDSIDEDLQQQ